MDTLDSGAGGGRGDGSRPYKILDQFHATHYCEVSLGTEGRIRYVVIVLFNIFQNYGPLQCPAAGQVSRLYNSLNNYNITSPTVQ